jgi:hypothetical protein
MHHGCRAVQAGADVSVRARAAPTNSAPVVTALEAAARKYSRLVRVQGLGFSARARIPDWCACVTVTGVRDYDSMCDDEWKSVWR